MLKGADQLHVKLQVFLSCYMGAWGSKSSWKTKSLGTAPARLPDHCLSIWRRLKEYRKELTLPGIFFLQATNNHDLKMPFKKMGAFIILWKNKNTGREYQTILLNCSNCRLAASFPGLAYGQGAMGHIIPGVTIGQRPQIHFCNRTLLLLYFSPSWVIPLLPGFRFLLKIYFISSWHKFCIAKIIWRHRLLFLAKY